MSISDRKLLRFFIITITLCSSIFATSHDFVIEKEFAAVTVGSTIKLAHQSSGYRLHSHDVKYGSGSGQQSVTAYPHGNDPNSLFFVSIAPAADKGRNKEFVQLKRGQPIPCNAFVRLQHVGTGKFLHSHGYVEAPISGFQEVSCFDGKDSGDDWKVVCVNDGAKNWLREEQIRLQHADSQMFLGSSQRFRYQRVIEGQLEISCRPHQGTEEVWKAQEGLYISSASEEL